MGKRAISGFRRPASRWLAALASLGVFAGSAALLWACADESCSSDWQLASPMGDCDGRLLISPGNDTRINLLLLMRSLRPLASPQGRYPKADWDYHQLGHTFFTWEGLRASFWPQAADGDGEAATSGANNPECAPAGDALAAFQTALQAEDGVPENERKILLALHAKTGCPDVVWPAQGLTQAPAGESAVSSSRGREYLAYLKAADAFYGGRWDEARQGFAALAHARSRWVAETAAYMPIRIGLRAAVAGAIDQYGDFSSSDKSKVDATATAGAKTAILAYLKAYPRGRYAASASGLMRRVMWLQGDDSNLARAYEQLLRTTPADSEAAADLAEEIDRKLLGAEDADAAIAGAGDTPLLLAVSDLQRMRVASDGKPMPLSAGELAGQQARFATDGDLYGFLQATRSWYAGGEPRAILPLIPDAARQPSYSPLAFSRQMLRGMALGRLHDPNETGFWRDLLGGADPLWQRPLAELGLALRWQHDGQIGKVFAPGSPITDSTTREILLETMASPAILRQAARDTARPARELEVARFTLLYKDLLRGAYADFGRDVALVPAGAAASSQDAEQTDAVPTLPLGLFTHGKWSDGFACPALAQSVATLARAPDDRRAKLCLGDFWRINGFDGFSLFSDGAAGKGLGSGPDLFPGQPLARDAIYAAIIADPHAAPDERAYALYRAVMCYAPSGYNSCAGPFTSVAAMDKADVPKAQRKAWFTALKRSYPNSPWASALQYYW